MKKNYINLLKLYFNKYKIDGYIIPKNDEFFSEYDPHKRLFKISNFTGSAGLAIITKEKNYLFVDGRYILQAKKESGRNFRVIDITKTLPKKIFMRTTFGVDPKIITSNNLKKLFHKKTFIKTISLNLIDTSIPNKTHQKSNFLNSMTKLLAKKDQ